MWYCKLIVESGWDSFTLHCLIHTLICCWGDLNSNLKTIWLFHSMIMAPVQKCSYSSNTASILIFHIPRSFAPQQTHTYPIWTYSWCWLSWLLSLNYLLKFSFQFYASPVPFIRYTSVTLSLILSLIFYYCTFDYVQIKNRELKNWWWAEIDFNIFLIWVTWKFFFVCCTWYSDMMSVPPNLQLNNLANKPF